MASVSSLDQDMRKLRLDRYTPQAASEAISWIESSLGERLATRDLLAALKDGVVLCKLANLVLPSPGLRFKASSMPFTQRENIAHFLEACERPPLNLPAHDRFLTVDLYDEKDPAQVLQCLGAFSRAANRINPRAFPTTIGPKRADGGGVASLENAYSGGKGYSGTTADSGYGARSPPVPSRERTITPTATGGSNSSPPKPSPLGGGVSSWSKKSDEHSTAPAWNIHQYGYMGGASQGNQGIAFGARRQIIPPSVDVPSREEKERLRREREVTEQAKAEEADRKRRDERDAEEARARAEEEARWQEETRKLREREARDAEEERIRREQYERRRKQEEDARLQEEERERRRQEEAARTAEHDRIKDLERQLEEAKARERRYEQDRAVSRDPEPAAPSLPTRPTAASTDGSSWDGDEREYLRKQWNKNQPSLPPSSGMSTATSSRPLPFPRPGAAPPPSATRPLPQPSNQPLEEPQAEPQPAPPPRAVATPPAASTTPRGMSTPKKYGMSLLEREMERERARQREWEEAQMKKMKGEGGR